MHPRHAPGLVLASLATAFAATAAQAAPPFTATEMMKLGRLADPQLSPDGTQVAYALTEIDLAGATRNTDLWLVLVAGGEPRRLTSNPASDSRPRFGPDGRTLAFLSTRDGSSQVWALDLAGGEARKLTSLATGVDAFEWLGAKRLALVSEVFPDCGADDACNAKKLGEAGKPSTARVYDELLYRHWDTWDDGRRSHVLSFALDGGALADLTPGGDDAPPFNLGGEDWGVSPDGSELCVAKKDAKGEAWHTNAELYLIPATGDRPAASPTRPATTAAAATAPTGGSSPGARSGARATRPIPGGSSSTTGRAARSARSPSPSTARWIRWCSRRTRRRSTSRPRTRASRRCSRCRWPEGRSRPSSPGRARSGTSGSRATARRSSPRTRRSPTPRRWSASERTGRASRA